jgi:hypothetical protein
MTEPAELQVDHIENMVPMGWSGFGHFHWYTESDPKGRESCPICGGSDD